MQEYDIIIIGAGPGGYEMAAEAAAEGQRVLIVERDLPGGTCLNRGCIPTKTLCRSAQAALDLRDFPQLGIVAEGTGVDYAKVSERMQSVVAQLRAGVESQLAATTFVSGEARLGANRTVMVGDDVFTAPKVVIATGSKPSSLPIPGAELAIDSDQIFKIDRLPESITIVGGGVIGMEFASIMSAFGVQVNVVEYCPEILPPFDREIAKRLRSLLSRRGINVAVGAEVKQIALTEAGGRVVSYVQKGKEKSVEAQMVLMAVGRKAVVPEGCQEAGVEVGRRGIVVDEHFATTAPGIYAIGDCNGTCMLAHAATAQGMAVLGHKVRLDVVPSAVFTVPECAMVGLTEEQCQAQGIAYRTGKSLYRANGKAMAMDEPDGFAKVIVDETSRRVLGCHIIGAHAADLVAEAALAMTANLTVDTTADTIHAHPTLAEVLQAAARQVK